MGEVQVRSERMDEIGKGYAAHYNIKMELPKKVA
jgi:(p)ppGpp synthase/HD superfamily hydrolase